MFNIKYHQNRTGNEYGADGLLVIVESKHQNLVRSLNKTEMKKWKKQNVA